MDKQPRSANEMMDDLVEICGERINELNKIIKKEKRKALCYWLILCAYFVILGYLFIFYL
jgi:hypothetical protein